ncbi:hypothetical protein GH714_028251 [Hevea brasiliensis]|uniref:Protein FAR1-RELATED SEQUENCE n=1 Tax=Hevea brasiliensis TaxID=3981 RepID=A0A6A6LJL3_HEVBR|nr:hypothetical protein GH714_028251 [Hevea brasiliensis]
MMQESQSGGDGQRSNIHDDEIAYNVKEGPKTGMHFPTMDNLGCALLSHEDVETFKWVFSTWLPTMADTHPHAILTNQCESIGTTIREVMPETRHRFGLWHIISKLLEKFKGMEDFTKATNEFKALIFDTLTIEMFERNWNQFLTKIVSTQRSEGMHAYFDGYANARSTLKQFIEQYEMAICGKTEKELLSEFISKNRLLTTYLHLDGKDSFNMHSLMKCSSWFKSKLSAYVGSENAGITNSDSSIAILNPHEARSHGRPRSNRFRLRSELNGGSNCGRSRGKRGRHGHGTGLGGGG